MNGTIYTAIVGTKDGPKYRLAHRDEDGNLSYINDTIYDTIQEADDAADELKAKEQQDEDDLIYDAAEMQADMWAGYGDTRAIIPPVIPHHYKPMLTDEEWEALV